MLDRIVIRGAREHNLKNIDLDIPRGQLTVVTGVSGSGKSTLAFDTLYAEGQRRYIESLSTYAKQFLERIGRPDVDEVLGISPSIAIQQKNTTRSSRSTVGTSTEIYDYLRLLFARAGRTFCPVCDREVVKHEPDEAAADMLSRHRGEPYLIVASHPVEKGVPLKRHFQELLRDGYSRILVDGEIVKLDPPPKRRFGRPKSIDIVLDRIEIDESRLTRIHEAVERAYQIGHGFVRFVPAGGSDGEVVRYTHHRVCVTCGRQFEEPRPLLFSFNTPYGACPHCRGFGNRMEFDEKLIVPDDRRSIRGYAIDPWSSEKFAYFHDQVTRFCRRRKIPLDRPWAELPDASKRLVLDGAGDYVGVLPFLENLREKTYKKYARFFTRKYMVYRECRRCGGGRLRGEAYDVKLGGVDIRAVSSMTPDRALAFVTGLELDEKERQIAKDVLVEIESRLQFMLDVGLHYVTLNRLTKTLSGGEAQRISLANSLGANLRDVLYVLDEPSIGLHPRDTGNLVKVLMELRSRGNTVVVVEHDLDIIRRADHIVDMGPGAGEYGGEIVYQGPVDGGDGKGKSKTLLYLKRGLPVAGDGGPAGGRKPKKGSNGTIGLRGVREHNLKNIDVDFPLGAFTCVTGVSGSGKSTLVCDVLYHALRADGSHRLHDYREVVGRNRVNGVMMVDQSPIGKTPRSNPTTYIKAFAQIREIFASQPKAVKRGYQSGRFSFNVAGGRCSRCQGMGYERVEMHFMADLFVRCSECEGKRFNHDTLEVTFRGLDLAEVLELTVDDACEHFAGHGALVARLRVLSKVGLGYIRLGQPSTTLSGGESQRIKIARELAENTEGGSVYLLDEPTTGLHVDDVATLIAVLRELMENQNSIIVVEHNPQVILQSDHVIDLGPGGGADGGEVVAVGSPRQVSRAKQSYTGAYLRKIQRESRKVQK